MSEPGKDEASGISRRRDSARRERSAAWVERHDQILAAAAEVLRESGFGATHITDIAQRLGVHQSNIYYYFATKEEIFFELIHDVVDANTAQAEAIAASDLTPTRKMSRIIETLASSYDRHYPLMQIYVQEDIGTLGGTVAAEHFVDTSTRYEAAVVSIAREGISTGEFGQDLDPRMVMFTVLGAVNWMHRWFRSGGKSSGESVGQSLSRILIHGLANDAPAVEAGAAAAAAEQPGA